MKTVIAGGGPIGLATAMLLARDGHEVTVFEKDSHEVRASWQDAWDSWDRTGVAQFRQPHFMMPRFLRHLDAELPAVRDRVEKLGGRRFNLTQQLPLPSRALRPGDERFETLTARRPVLETAFAQVARETSGITIRRGVGVQGPLSETTNSGIPHVSGVRTDDGMDVAADLVIDAMGRRSKLPEWVRAIGGRSPYEEASDAGFAYYARHYGAHDGAVPEYRAGIGTPIGSFQTLTILADNNTWTVGLLAIAGDRPLKALRYNEVWERVARSVPHMAGWTEGTALCDVLAMAGVLDRYRRMVVDGTPVVTGLVPVGDAWACTNPSAGRGIALGLAHAVALRDASRRYGDDPRRLAVEYDRVTEEQLTPWYRDQVARDRRRAVFVQSIIDGTQPPRPNGDASVAFEMAVLAGFASDPDLARAWLEILGCLTLPADLASRAGMSEKVARFAGSVPPAMPGPTRAELLALVS